LKTKRAKLQGLALFYDFLKLSIPGQETHTDPAQGDKVQKKDVCFDCYGFQRNLVITYHAISRRFTLHRVNPEPMTAHKTALLGDSGHI
jgi:hypothetical protein